jgi:hypothetical protein
LLEQFRYNTDGSIPTLFPSAEGVTKSVANLNPFIRVQAETMAWSKGLKTATDSKTGVYVSQIDNGDYLEVKHVDFGNGAKQFEARIAYVTGGTIEIRTDSTDGPVISTINAKMPGNGSTWTTITSPVTNVSGIHDLYFVFKGDKDLFNFDWWQFK